MTTTTFDDLILAAIERHAARPTGSYPEGWTNHPRNPRRTVADGVSHDGTDDSPSTPDAADAP